MGYLVNSISGSNSSTYEITPKFWGGRRVLVTGHTGFKGSWLSLWLTMMGAQVSGISLPPKKDDGRLFTDLGLSQLVSSIFIDIRDRAAVLESIVAFEPEVVFHLAAQPLVSVGYEDPVGTFETNLLGLVHVFEGCRAAGSVKAFISVTSDKCYQNNKSDWGYREIDPMGGDDPYSCSKGCAELISRCYAAQLADDEIHVATARAGNVFGGGDFSLSRLIPEIVQAIKLGSRVIVRNPNHVRPWQYVLDPLHGYLILAERMINDSEKFSSSWNFGPLDGGASVMDLVRLIEEVSGTRVHCEERAESVDFKETELLRLDATKARFKLGWMPKVSIREGLAMTLDWHDVLENNPKSVQYFSTQQIESFMEQKYGI